MRTGAMIFALLVSVLACGTAGPGPGDLWTTADYVGAGVPDPTRAWTDAELTAAVAAIAKAGADHRDRLPQFHGAHSGVVFARVVASMPVDAAAAVPARVGSLFAREEALRTFSKLYAVAPLDVPRREQIEAWGAMLANYVQLEPLTQPFVDSFGPTDPAHATRLAGLAKVHAGIGDMMLGGVMIADDLRAPIADRAAMLAYVARVVPVLFSHLTPQARENIRRTLGKLIDESSGGLHDDAVAMQHALPVGS